MPIFLCTEDFGEQEISEIDGGYCVVDHMWIEHDDDATKRDAWGHTTIDVIDFPDGTRLTVTESDRADHNYWLTTKED